MNDRFKFRVWDKKHNEYIPSNMIGTLLYFGRRDEFHVEFECFSTFADSLIIEQCTGLKDKNGKLIYEGDIVKTRFGRKFKVVWSQEDVMFDGRMIIYDPEYGDRYDLYEGATDDVEIIGNIHEQAEQKD